MVRRLSPAYPRPESERLTRRPDGGRVDGDRSIRVCLVAPSLDVVGGQAVQAARLYRGLRNLPSVAVGFVPINPRLPGLLRLLQRVRYVRTAVTWLRYVWTLLKCLANYDVVHVFSAAYMSFIIAPTPAV